MNKDGLKEILFDTLEWRDREWSRRLGAASMLLFYCVERQFEEMRAKLLNRGYRPLSRDGEALIVDTTDLAQLDY